MFKTEDILEFLTRIIKNGDKNNIKESKESIMKFQEYLKLTTMCDEGTINAISDVANCFEELVNIYSKTGICDLNPIFKLDSKKEVKKPKEKVHKRTFENQVQEKHYDRYIPTTTSYTSSCGSSSSSYSYGSSCGSSSSSSSYGSRC